jgi:hypothetical protein
MSPLFDADKEAVRHERAVTSLCDRSGAPLAEVRSLFAQEYSRLELGAKVRSYLAVLAASKVHAMLRRKGGVVPTETTRRDQVAPIRGGSRNRDGLPHERVAA